MFYRLGFSLKWRLRFGYIVLLLQDKFHLFTWTDECVVEEIEDLKSMMCDVKGEKSDLRVEVVELQKELERIKLTLERDKNYCCCFL